MSDQSPNKESDSIPLNFRLWRIEAELAVLERYFELIEEHIEISRKNAERTREAHIKEIMAQWSDDLDDPSSDGWAELDLISQEHDMEVDFVQPRMLRGPCLVVLYSVYESAITEAADAIHYKKGKGRSIRMRQRNFLENAQKYYSSVLQFDLSTSKDHWEKLKLLSDLRNIIAHTNGHLDKKNKERYAESLCNPGVSEKYHCLLVSGDLLRELFIAVKEELESLVRRYKRWDDESQL